MKSHASNPHGKNQIMGSNQEQPCTFTASALSLYSVREEQLFVKEPDYRYPIRPYVIEFVFLALGQWTIEGYATSQQDV